MLPIHPSPKWALCTHPSGCLETGCYCGQDPESCPGTPFDQSLHKAVEKHSPRSDVHMHKHTHILNKLNIYDILYLYFLNILSIA